MVVENFSNSIKMKSVSFGSYFSRNEDESRSMESIDTITVEDENVKM